MVIYNIIPKPNKYVYGDSEYEISSKSEVLCSKEFVEAGNYLTDYLKTKPEENEGFIKIKKVEGMPSEAYTLKITNDGVFINAGDYAGAFYGAVTLKTILMQAKKQNGKAVLNTLVIEDKPDNAYRGAMLDCSRHFFEADTVKSLLDNMAFLKLNKFHWHLSDDQGFRIESKQFPELNEIGSKRASRHLKGFGMENDNAEDFHFYTQEEIKDIVAYAKQRNIEIIPEIDLPGHTMAILAAKPELSCTGEKAEVLTVNGISKAILCAGNEAVFEFLDKLFDEICPLFPSAQFHIGGDEAFRGYKLWDDCPKCSALKQKEGIGSNKELQIWFMNRVCALLKKHGKTPVAWDDCMGDSLDSSIACQFWRPNAVASVRKQSLKRDVIISSTSYFYFDLKYSVISLKKAYKFNKVKVGLNKPGQRILGLECELWTEWIDSKASLEFSAFPRMNAFAEVAWTELKNRSFTDFYKRLAWYKTYMKIKDVNYSRVESGFILPKGVVYHLGEDGDEFKKSAEIKNAEK